MGVLYSFYSDWNVVVEPDYITAEYQYREDGTYGVLVSWGISEVNPWLNWFILERYDDPDSSSPVEEWHITPDHLEYFDEIGPGTYYYRLYAGYSAGGGVPSLTGYAPNLENPELDYAMVTVTSVEEQFDMTHATVRVYNALGQKVYEGEIDTFDERSLKTTTLNVVTAMRRRLDSGRPGPSYFPGKRTSTSTRYFLVVGSKVSESTV